MLERTSAELERHLSTTTRVVSIEERQQYQIGYELAKKRELIQQLRFQIADLEKERSRNYPTTH